MSDVEVCFARGGAFRPVGVAAEGAVGGIGIFGKRGVEWLFAGALVRLLHGERVEAVGDVPGCQELEAGFLYAFGCGKNGGRGMSKLQVDLTGNSSGFQQMLNQAKTHASAFSSSVSKEVSSSWGGLGKSFAGGIAGALSFEGIKGLFKGVFEDAMNLKDMTEQFDVGAESIQKWDKALGKSGVSINQYFRSLEMLRSKRADARSGGSNAFAALGLGAEAVGSDLSDEDLLKRVLGSGGSRNAINDVLGRGGAKMKNALSELSGSDVVFTDEDLRRLNEIEQKGKTFWGGVKKVTGGIMVAFNDLASPSMWSRARMNTREKGEADYQKKKAAAQVEKDAAAADKAEQERLSKEKKAAEEAKATKEYEDKKATAEDRLKNIQRSGMSGEAKRQDLRKELAEVQKKLKPLSGSEWENTSAENLKKLDLQAREADLKNQLKGGSKPMGFQADSLAKVGLFTSSTVAYNPLLNVQQQQLVTLKSIDRKLSATGRDPFE
ncbi:MAG: hypothetical protein ACTHLW_02165 [Verrucomicrobiota bacterium]